MRLRSMAIHIYNYYKTNLFVKTVKGETRENSNFHYITKLTL
jgi:hypothetical protein